MSTCSALSVFPSVLISVCINRTLTANVKQTWVWCQLVTASLRQWNLRMTREKYNGMFRMKGVEGERGETEGGQWWFTRCGGDKRFSGHRVSHTKICSLAYGESEWVVTDLLEWCIAKKWARVHIATVIYASLCICRKKTLHLELHISFSVLDPLFSQKETTLWQRRCKLWNKFPIPMARTAAADMQGS